MSEIVPKSTFSEEHILASRGCCAFPQFLYALENHQVLVAHSPPGTAALLTFFKGSEGQKLT